MPQLKKQKATDAVVAVPTKLVASSGMVSAWDMLSNLIIMIFGDSGTGKTTLWGTFPGPILAYICTSLETSGELISLDTPEMRAKIDSRLITNLTQFQEDINAVDLSRYKTIVLDHGTALQDLVIKEHMGLEDIPVIKARKAEKGESWGVVPRAEWTEINTIMGKILRKILNAKCNVVIVLQEKIFKGKEDIPQAADVIKPAIGGALSPGTMQWLNPACNYIVQTFKRPKMVTTVYEHEGEKVPMQERVKGVEYCLRLEEHDIITTKFRRPMGKIQVPDVIVNPTYSKIMAVIKGQPIK